MPRWKLSGFDGAVPRWPVEMRTLRVALAGMVFRSGLHEIAAVRRDRLEAVERVERALAVGDRKLVDERIDEDERGAVERDEGSGLCRRVEADVALERRE